MAQEIVDKSTLTRIGWTFLFFALASFMVYCKPWKHKSPAERAEAMVNRISKELSLNPSQLELLNTLKEKTLTQQRLDKAEHEKQLKDFSTLFLSPTIDKAKLAQLKKQHDSLRTRNESLFLENVVLMHNALTPEQRIKAMDVMMNYGKKNAEFK
ncbi:MAG TPA: Spy/CpxP family protein refolding chaperone [Turneriella sp.]|nr:Spy/CpxP family protein refolding chaperone [Turneriella sp.]